MLKKNPDDFNANFFKGSSVGFRGIFRLQKLQVFAAASKRGWRPSSLRLVRRLNGTSKYYNCVTLSNNFRNGNAKQCNCTTGRAVRWQKSPSDWTARQRLQQDCSNEDCGSYGNL